MSKNTSPLVPLIGFGTARLKGEECEDAVTAAILAGCRHFDCAHFYGNEVYVGNAIRSAIESGKVKREDLFITSKCWNDDHRPEDVVAACLQTLKDLGFKYLDLYLVHWPVAWAKGTLACPDFSVSILDTWKAMESLVDSKLVHYIGVSNFGPKLLTKMFHSCRIKPVCNQLEIHPKLAQPGLVSFCQQNQIQCVAWSPLAKFSSGIVQSKIIRNIAKKHSWTATQVILRWHIQRGVAVIPRSTNPSHIADNVKVASLSPLTDKEMDEIMTLNENQRIFPDIVGIFEDTPVFPFHILGYTGKGILFLFWFFVPHVFDFANPQHSLLEIFDRKRPIRWIDHLRITFLLVLTIKTIMGLIIR